MWGVGRLAAMRTDAIEVVLFDLGGVLIDFGGVEPMKSLAGITSDDELWRRWLECPWVRGFERGRCSADEFAAGVVADWRLPVAPADFLDAFRRWPRAPLPGADALVREVRRVVRVGCLSNTNALHWHDHFGRWPVLDGFDARFLSFEMGCIKPDREMFDRVSAELQTPGDRVLFLDDNAINVDAAVAAGMRATRVRGVDDARRALTAAGVLT
jgi:glucose-1-phosphatase